MCLGWSGNLKDSTTMLIRHCPLLRSHSSTAKRCRQQNVAINIKEGERKREKNVAEKVT
jgi:hypothetical protein